MNYFQLAYYAAGYCKSAYGQVRFINRFLTPLVHRLCTALEYTFSSREKHKATFYYPLFNHIFNCENYLTVKDRKLTEEESKRLAIISVMATLYDDLIDEERWDKQQLFAMLHRTLPLAEQTKKVQLIFALDDELKKIWQPTQKYIAALELAIAWQLESSKQLQAAISLAEIMQLSKEKCGNSSLLWASILEEDWEEEDLRFIYQSGLVGQLVNDAMDAFKDREDGVYTYIFKAGSIAEARDIFLAECSTLHQMVLASKAPMALRVKTIRKMAALHGFALVSLQHLQNTENKYTRPVNWQKVQRKELVTDMALWSNKLMALKFAVWLAKLR